MKPEDFNITYTSRVTFLENRNSSQSFFVRFWPGLIAAIFLTATVYLFGGVHELFLLSRTPTDTNPGNYETLADESIREIPATLFVLSDDGQPVESDRYENLVTKTNRVLSQASVKLAPVDYRSITTGSDISGPGLIANPRQLENILPTLAGNRLHIVVASGLGAVNGIAFSGADIVAVAEYTSTFDFRVLAHEVGHILSLKHTDDGTNLMYSGQSGTELTASQADRMYEMAARFSARS